MQEVLVNPLWCLFVVREQTGSIDLSACAVSLLVDVKRSPNPSRLSRAIFRYETYVT